MAIKNWYKTKLTFDESSISESGWQVINEVKQEAADNGGISVRSVALNEVPVFTEKWLEYMISNGLDPKTALIFYREPHYQYPAAHIDGGSYRKIVMGLNWIKGDDDSKMVWYNMPDHVPEMETLTDHVYSHTYDPATLTECESSTIGNSSKLALVRTDIPHNILMGANPRLAISIRFWLDFEDWDDVLEHFKDFIDE